MKDSKLIDNALLSLIRMPEIERTQEIICAHLTLAATAAGIELKGTSALQLEHLKLSSQLALLATELGDGFIHRATLRLGPDLSGVELFASLEAPDRSGMRFSSFGATAEQVLTQLGKAIARNNRAAEHSREMTLQQLRLPAREVRI